MNFVNLKKDFKNKSLQLINFVNLSAEELAMVLKWRNHNEIRKWMYSENIISTKEHEAYIKKLEDDNRNFAWVVKKENTLLGVITFLRVDWNNKNTYFGIYSNPYSKKVGIGRLLDDCSLFLAFEISKLHTMHLEVLESNKRVINLHKKMGFKEEGKLKDFVFKNETWQDVIVMGIKSEDYHNFRGGA